MTRVFSGAALLCVAGILVASAAVANVPDPTKSKLAYYDNGAPASADKGADGFILCGPTSATHPNGYLEVEGTTAGIADKCSDNRCGEFRVTVNDVGGFPIAGATVVADFSGCTDTQLSCDQTAGAGQTWFAGKKVQGTTDINGQFIFRVQGAATAAPTGVGNNTTSPGVTVTTPCAVIYADGVALNPSLRVASYDFNSLNSPTAAVNSADTSLLLDEGNKGNLGAIKRARGDFNRDGNITSADTSALLQMGGQAALNTGTQDTRHGASYCP